MNAAVVERFFGYSHAFAHPLTRGVVAFLGAALLVAPLIFMALRRTVKLADATYSELWARWRSWIWISIALVVPILLGAAWVIAGVFVLSLLCYGEFARATGIFREKMLGLSAVVSLLLIAFAVIDNYPRFFFATAVLGIGLIAVVTIPQDRPKGFIQRVALGMMGYLFFGFSFGYLAFATTDPLYRPLLLLLLLGVELNDVFAYCSGRLFGGPTLLPHTSPGKTRAGAIGAVVLTTALVLIIGHYAMFPGTPMDRWPMLLILGAGMSIFGQLGDLMLSSIKRDIGVKDLGHMLPGHGGLLDRFDSLVFVAPLYYHFLSLILGPLGQGQAERIITSGIAP